MVSGRLSGNREFMCSGKLLWAQSAAWNEGKEAEVEQSGFERKFVRGGTAK